ncbi:MAG: C39 family peptidase [Candidatus Taylorbacteria bacterium]
MKKILLDVKPFQETLHADMCGPATLKILFSHYGINKSEQELAKLCGLKPGLGIDDSAIVKVAQSLGLKSEIKNESTFQDVEAWLKKGVPLIVDWFTKGRREYPDSQVSDGHYSLLIGLDDELVYLQDPEIGGIRKIAREDFLKVWFDFRGKTIKPDELIIRQIIAIYR